MSAPLNISEHTFADMNITEDLLRWALTGLNDVAIEEFANTINILAGSTDLAWILCKFAYANQRYIHVAITGTIVKVTYYSKTLFTYDNLHRMPI